MINTIDLKHGLKVTINTRESDAVWELLDKSPKQGHWWLHRWEGDVWHTTEQHPKNLDAAGELAPALTNTTKWTKGAFNVTSRNSDTGAHRVQGHVVGVWGVHRNADKRWSLTHLPTGFSVPTNVWFGYNPVAADMRRGAEYLATLEFPELDASPFGVAPAREAFKVLEAVVRAPLPALTSV